MRASRRRRDVVLDPVEEYHEEEDSGDSLSFVDELVEVIAEPEAPPPTPRVVDTMR